MLEEGLKALLFIDVSFRRVVVWTVMSTWVAYHDAALFPGWFTLEKCPFSSAGSCAVATCRDTVLYC